VLASRLRYRPRTRSQAAARADELLVEWGEVFISGRRKELIHMTTFVRRDNREVSRTAAGEYRWDPFRVMDAFLRWDPLRVEGGLAARGGELAPRFDVKQSKDAFEIKADLPGVKDEDLDVSLTGALLTISGKREAYGTFTRSFSLPESADGERVTADLKHGVLTVVVPKKPEAQPRKIAVGKGDGGAKA
jgi:HSP20 family protein